MKAEIFNWKNKFNSIKLKLDKANEKKKTLKTYVKDKVENLVELEETLAHSNEIILEISNRYESENFMREKQEMQYQKDLESIINTLGSMRTYNNDTIKPDSIVEYINKSIKDIQDENRAVHNLKNENECLQKTIADYERIKEENYSLKLTIKELK